MEKGADKVEKSLEISELIKVQQDVKIIQNTLFTARQRQLIKVQKLRTINLDSSDQNSSELSDKSLKKPGDLKTRKKAKHLKKVTDMLKGKSLTDMDIKLLLGVIC